jgi:oligosaccharyltransferase complex subunit epsilon
MPPKQRNPTNNQTTVVNQPITFGHAKPAPAPAKPTTPSTPAKSSTTPSKATTSKVSNSNANAQDIVLGVWTKYLDQTPQRVKLIDTFMAFLIVVGVLQFVYVVVVGNFVRL